MGAPLNAQKNRWNFGVLLTQGVSREVGYELSSEKLVLPFVYASLGGPLFFAGLLLSVVEFCKFAAQLTGSPLIALSMKTKWYVGLCTLASAIALAVVTVISINLSPHLLVLVFLLTAAIIGFSKGFNNLAFQDLLGRSILEDTRARLLFVTGSVTGLCVVFTVIGSIFLFEVQSAQAAQLELISIGIGMLVIASLAVVLLKEQPKHRSSSAKLRTHASTLSAYFSELKVGMQTVAKLPWFDRYIKARILLVPIEVAMPFFAIHASRLHPDTTPSLSIFVIAGSIGMIIGGIVWPVFGKNSSRLTMSLASLIAALAALGALALQFYPPLRMPITHSLVFFLLTFAAQGAAVSKTVYLINMATDAQRPYCITLSNLGGGLCGLFLAFVLGSISHVQGAVAALIVMIPVNLVAAVYIRRLPVFAP